ncbi:MULTISPECIES: hypothetical protein [unclassified Streptomyces]|uniref:hypothetical protein n=1 Tax=unclassified Streptomyces TaxID=2593676 RepID=UPI00081F662E|nr:MULTISPECIES: hypothetical protein [unclassified Streptomyces]MYZ36346.1 hypothetical protein [Streptomyces sp. SID4917]SCF82836.1 hypothetical protein GA0115259_103247 [Streptomyces sp. MnatMP-M17]
MKILRSLGVLLAGAVLALGIGGGPVAVAYAADAPGGAGYSAADLATGRTTSGTVAGSAGHEREVPPQEASLSCWDPYFSGSTFAVSCSGNRYYVYVDCSNGYRYVVGPLAGAKRVTITCPGGYRALRGGGYGS